MKGEQSMSERLDALEAVAAKAITNTYSDALDHEARWWIQRGIEGMRYAVATENESREEVKSA